VVVLVLVVTIMDIVMVMGLTMRPRRVGTLGRHCAPTANLRFGRARSIGPGPPPG
jgi:hypothetical protein